MDKTESNVLDFMLAKTYKEALHRVLTAYILGSISEIKETLTVDKTYLDSQVSRYPDIEQPIARIFIKESVLMKLLHSDKVKKQLTIVLKDVVKIKDSVIQELIKQYGLQKDSNVNVIHDRLSVIFDSLAAALLDAIEAGNYGYIYQPWRE